MGINKVICVYEGIPLWSSAVKDERSDSQTDTVMIGGFLSAINSFAMQTENKTIRNLTIGDSFWSITKIYNQDNFFLAVHTDVLLEDSEKPLRIRTIERFIIEILTEFTKLYPEDFFKKSPVTISIFKGIKDFTKEKINTFNLLLDRYQVRAEQTNTALTQNPACFKTEFKCGLCDKMIQFDICDNTTFFSKTIHQVFFGAELSTYKVGHYEQDEVHVNSALVDKKGVLYEVIDSYSVKAKELLKQQGLGQKLPIYLLEDGHPPITTHRYIERMVILDKTQPWVMEVVGASPDDAQPLGLQIINKTREFEEIYTKNTGTLSVVLNDKEFHIWNSGAVIVSACFKDVKIVDVFSEIASYLTRISSRGEEWLNKRDRINVALQIFANSTVTKDDLPLLQRIISDDLLDVKLKIKYVDQIPRIIERLGREFILAKEVLNPLLRGQVTILGLLEQKYNSKFRELLSLVDFVNRRNLVS